MQNIYLNNIVDIADPDCLFIKEFDREIRKYGAVVYNREFNSYQYVQNFRMIDLKREVLPDFLKLEEAHGLKALNMTVHYEFDPQTETDPENLEVWKELSQIRFPYFGYDDDGEAFVEKQIPLTTTNSVHTIWFLKPESYQYILDIDLLMLFPYIKNLNIARELIRKYGIHPFEAEYDMDEIDSYKAPDLSAYFAESIELVEDDEDYNF